MDFYADGIRLSAELDRPDDGKDTHPLVLIIHGWTGNKDERHITAMSRMMNDIGFSTLRADMYGHGGSEGDFRDHTLFKWLTEIIELIDYARSLDDVTDIYLCGHSQGALAAILTAAIEKDRIAGLIPLSPAVTIPESCRKGEVFGAQFDPDKVPDQIETDKGVLGGNYIRVAQMLDTGAAIDRFDKPVLIVHGSDDLSVPSGYGLAAAERYRDAEFVLIPGDTHCYDFYLEKAVDAVKEWLLRR